jgi:hypothetical protein
MSDERLTKIENDIAEIYKVLGYLTHLMNTLTEEEKRTVLDRWQQQLESAGGPAADTYHPF